MMLLKQILYDIEHNPTRNQLSKYLEQMGLTRVQYSVFIGKLTGTQWLHVQNSLEKKFKPLLQNTDKLYIWNLSETELEKAKMLGLPIDLDRVLERKTYLFIE